MVLFNLMQRCKINSSLQYIDLKYSNSSTVPVSVDWHMGKSSWTFFFKKRPVVKNKSKTKKSCLSTHYLFSESHLVGISLSGKAPGTYCFIVCQLKPCFVLHCSLAEVNRWNTKNNQSFLAISDTIQNLSHQDLKVSYAFHSIRVPDHCVSILSFSIKG